MNNLCKVERQKVIQTSTLNLVTGERKIRTTKTIIEPCNTPLFGDLERNSGVCNSCASGWSIAENAPTPKGLRLLQRPRS